MNWYDAMEEAYKHGYDKGKEDAQKDVRHGHWIIRSSGKGAFANIWVECSVCLTCGSPHWKVCPVCETKMDGKEYTYAED